MCISQNKCLKFTLENWSTEESQHQEIVVQCLPRDTELRGCSPVILLRRKTVRKGNRVLNAPHFQGLDLEMFLAKWDALECVTRL